MATGDKPWGYVSACIERDGKAHWVRIGTVWRTDSGHLTTTLDVLPTVWGDPWYQRRITIVERQDSQSNNARSRSTRTTKDHR